MSMFQHFFEIGSKKILFNGLEIAKNQECENALQQITDVRYTESLKQEGIHKIIKYGIACYKKKYKVMMKIEL